MYSSKISRFSCIKYFTIYCKNGSYNYREAFLLNSAASKFIYFVLLIQLQQLGVNYVLNWFHVEVQREDDV